MIAVHWLVPAWIALAAVGLIFAVLVTAEAYRDLQAARMLNGAVERVAARTILHGQIIRVLEFVAMLTAGGFAAANLTGYGVVRGSLMVLAALITLNTFLAWRAGRKVAAALDQ